MSFPLVTDYKGAVSNAATRFATLKLEPDMGADKAPVYMAGNFAVVFKATLKSSGKKVALKCFIRDMKGIEKRYQAISDMIQRTRAPIFINLKFLPNELYVTSTTAGNGNYPVLMMPWVEGRTMGEVIKGLCHNSKQKGLASLTRVWARLCLSMMSLGIAHGDLKHDNVLATPDANLKLVDYDSMYVPVMKGLPSLVLGGVHFQHPKRQTHHFGPNVDHFSMLVITLTLRALALEPILYARCNSGENLIFSRKDFLAPRQSKLIGHLAGSRDALVRDWTKRLIAASTSDSIAVPGLDQVLKQAEKSSM
ncbi:MAG: protein kinase family protein [Alphaproteobacteria bacterium]|nr:protein kinase family protein [Alphaproteobacteria bacterium]MBF0129850.1 protein kinase family protein [Alphaproteobacteria bacterium]